MTGEMGDTEKKPDSEVAEESKPSLVEDTKASESGQTASDKALPAKTDGKANNKSPKKPKVAAEPEPAQAAAAAAAADKEGTSGSEGEDEDEEDEEPRLGLLEQPVLIESGKRERKKVERLSEQLSAAVSPSDRKSLLSLEGSGEKLGDCPEIERELRKQGPDDLKTLHRILYGRSGAVTEVKRNIRKFCGFTFGKESDEYNRKLDSLLRSTTNQSLKAMCAILAQERSGTKEQMAERILDFLLCPKSTGVRVRKSRAGRKGRKPKSNDTKSTETKERKKRKSKSGEQNDGSSEQADGQLESDKSDDSDADSTAKDYSKDEDSGSSDNKAEGKAEPKAKESPKKRAEVKSPKKETAAKAKKTRTVKEPKEPKQKAAKKQKAGNAKGPKVKVAKKRVKGGDGNSDDEPLLKKVKQEPTEDDLRKLIKKILDSANLEEVTMKTVIKKVFSEFPEADLTPKKDFIKETVKEILGA